MFLTKIKESFLSLESSTEDTIKYILSLKHLNYLNSEDNIKVIIDNLEDLKSVDPENDIEDIRNITKEHTFKGKKHSTDGIKLYCLQRCTRFPIEDVTNFIDYMKFVSDIDMLCEYFKDTFERTIKPERMLWLTDEKLDDIEELVMKLGLYHMETITTDDTFFLFEFELNEYFKPTWIDSGFVFYFNAQTENYDHGLTLNLENGLDGLKEFISYRKNVKLKNILLLKSQKIIKTHELSSTFWNNIKDKIFTKRV